MDSTWSGCTRAIRTGCSTPIATVRCRTGARSSVRCSVGTSALTDTCRVGSSRRWASALRSSSRTSSRTPPSVSRRRAATGLPVVAHVASWDHTVGKGVISPNCDVYVVQNRVMEDDLRRYHDIGPERVRVTGWPQTDIFSALVRAPTTRLSFGDTGSTRAGHSSSAWKHSDERSRTRTRFVERLLPWWEASARDASSSSFVLIHATASGASASARSRWGDQCLRARAELHGPRGAHGAPPARGCHGL